MRYLIVHTHELGAARTLIAALDPLDLTILSYAGSKRLDDETRAIFASDPNAEVCLIRVRKKFRKSLVSIGVTVEIQGESVAAQEERIRAWLLPTVSEPVQAPFHPSVAFMEAANSAERLVIANGALASADNLESLRHDFAANAATALADCAEQGHAAGGFQNFFSSRGLRFASSGSISVKVSVFRAGSLLRSARTEWHLKQGDATTPQAAARIYFYADSAKDPPLIYVLYCGPHPTNSFESRVDLPLPDATQ